MIFLIVLSDLSLFSEANEMRVREEQEIYFWS